MSYLFCTFFRHGPIANGHKVRSRLIPVDDQVWRDVVFLYNVTDATKERCLRGIEIYKYSISVGVTINYTKLSIQSCYTHEIKNS